MTTSILNRFVNIRSTILTLGHVVKRQTRRANIATMRNLNYNRESLQVYLNEIIWVPQIKVLLNVSGTNKQTTY